MSTTKLDKTGSRRGGARLGAGRPLSGNISVTIRLSPEHNAKLRALGGSNWIVQKLDEEPTPEEATASLARIPKH